LCCRQRLIFAQRLGRASQVLRAPPRCYVMTNDISQTSPVEFLSGRRDQYCGKLVKSHLIPSFCESSSLCGWLDCIVGSLHPDLCSGKTSGNLSTIPYLETLMIQLRSCKGDTSESGKPHYQLTRIPKPRATHKVNDVAHKAAAGNLEK